MARPPWFNEEVNHWWNKCNERVFHGSQADSVVNIAASCHVECRLMDMDLLIFNEIYGNFFQGPVR